MNTFKKTINRILIVSCGFLIVIIGFSFFYYWYNNTHKELVCGNINSEFCCGNNSTKLSEKAQRGKEIFNSNCAACHNLNKNMTGPALSKIDSTKLWNWLTEKNKKADTTKLSKMKIDYHKIIWERKFDESQVNDLYEYLKSE